MTDIIFHIGLAKCASSTLQQQVFRQESGYLGTAPHMPNGENLAKQLQQVAPFDGRQTTSRQGLRRWANTIRRLQAERWPKAERVILSNEMLSSASRLKDRPILDVLAYLKRSLWAEGRVRVVLVLRSQASRMASGYAQGSRVRWQPGQLDFERDLDRKLSNPRFLRLLDYSAWVQGLCAVLGTSNVCILLLEEAREPSFWQNLADFCELECFDPMSMVSGETNRRNVHRSAVDRWTISPLDTRFGAKVAVEKWLNLTWPTHLAPSRRAQVRETLIDKLAVAYDRKASGIDLANRETEIRLRETAMASIRSACGAGNDRLAEQLERDLRSLGY